MSRTVAMIMAGGKGSRLAPLTCHRAKPAVPFGGRYRIIDFVLSNFLNSGYRQIFVLTQYMSSSLIQHLNRNWHISGMNAFVEVVPAQMRMGTHWYRGTADSIFQNINLILDARADNVAVFGGDHIYKFDVNKMEREHLAHDADLTVAAFPVPKSQAHQFGVIEVDEDGNIVKFWEKPKNPIPMPGHPDTCLVSMGNYFFKAEVLVDAVSDDAQDPGSAHDFGRNIIPKLLRSGCKLRVYNFGDNKITGESPEALPYWRDVGTLDSFFVANMEIRNPLPTFNLYNRQWRIRTAQRDYPPARFVRAGQDKPVDVIDAMVCEGSIIESTVLDRAVVGYDCFIHSGSLVETSVIFSGCDIGRGVHLRKVLFDKNCSVAPGVSIGVDPESDRQRFPFITPSGLIVLPKGTHVPEDGPIEFTRDIYDLLNQDPAAREFLDRFDGEINIAERRRHSYASAGPRFRRYSGDPTPKNAANIIPPAPNPSSPDLDIPELDGETKS